MYLCKVRDTVHYLHGYKNSKSSFRFSRNMGFISSGYIKFEFSRR